MNLISSDFIRNKILTFVKDWEVSFSGYLDTIILINTDPTSTQVFAKFWIIIADYDKIRKNTQKCTKKGFVQILQKRLKTAPRPFPHYSLCKSLSLTYFLKISSISHLSWSFPHCPLYQLFLPLHPTHLISNLKFFKRIRFNNWFAKCEKIEIWKKKWQHLFKFRYYQT